MELVNNLHNHVYSGNCLYWSVAFVYSHEYIPEAIKIISIKIKCNASDYDNNEKCLLNS